MCVGEMVPLGSPVPLVSVGGLVMFGFAGGLVSLKSRVSAVVHRLGRGLPMVFMRRVLSLCWSLCPTGSAGTAMPSMMLMPWHGLRRLLLALGRQQGLLEAPWPT